MRKALRPRESTVPIVKRCVYVCWHYMRRLRLSFFSLRRVMQNFGQHIHVLSFF